MKTSDVNVHSSIINVLLKQCQRSYFFFKTKNITTYYIISVPGFHYIIFQTDNKNMTDLFGSTSRIINKRVPGAGYLFPVPYINMLNIIKARIPFIDLKIE
jgi:hypothetical protein